jgi:parvulin-like peptidyl-prolyl isomerase
MMKSNLIKALFWVIMSALTVVTIAGCATHPRATEPVTPTAAEARAEEKRVAEPATQPATSAEADPHKIAIAKVNGVELHMDALIRMMNRLAPRESGSTPESLEDHRKKSLDKLVLQELAYQQAKVQGLSIGADKIDMAIQNFKENVGGEKEYAEYLTKENITETDLRAQVERILTVELIYAREVLAKVVIPEDQLKQEYEKEKDRYVLPVKASVVDVFVLKQDGKASSKKAKELLGRIKRDAGKDPWKLVLDGSFIVRYLNINKDREKELFEAAKKLKPNELSGVIETATGSHIIKLKDYSPERQLTFDEVRSKIEMKFKVPAQEKRTQEWEQELKKDAKIEIVDSGAGSR